MSRKPTGRHEKVFYFIKSYMAENGFAPAVRDIAEFLQSSTCVALHYLKQLEKSGYISRRRSIARSIILCKSEYKSAARQQN